MQVSLAAALDVGGGNRFDVRQNRLLGRAYLARMFRRYGNWPDALAAYNWGPRNLDMWITAGRSVDRLPLEVVRYVARVLSDAMVVDAREARSAGVFRTLRQEDGARETGWRDQSRANPSLVENSLRSGKITGNPVGSTVDHP
jgi:hypothetical protein